ncbi:MAG: class A beta-lactamase-related serine hydrolase, partial [Sphingobacteriales bacterium]
MKPSVILLSILLLCTTAFGQQPDSLAYKLDAYFTALTGLKNFNGNVLVAKDGRVLLDKTYTISGETDSLEVTRGSRFIIASVSKVFVKFGILKLAEQKKLRLSDKLSRFIPGFPGGDKISIEQLMYHQSGLPRELTNAKGYDSLSLSRIVDLAKSERLQFEPGTQTLYSNIGYFLLHYIIDQTSGSGYLAFIQREIFDKMGLKSTAEFNSGKPVPAFAYGFDNENGKVVPTSQKSINRFETGNYLSTIGDLYRFSRQV